MCFCARSCDFGIKSYCCYCSTMKIVDTNETSYFASFIVEPHDFDYRICKLFSKSIVPFEVFDVTSHWLGKNVRCIKFGKINSVKVLFKYFVTIRFRIFCNFFNDVPLKSFYQYDIKLIRKYRKVAFTNSAELFYQCANKCDLRLFPNLFKLSYRLRDYNCRCFKILNSNYYLFVKQNNNYLREHKKDKDFDINKFY